MVGTSYHTVYADYRERQIQNPPLGTSSYWTNVLEPQVPPRRTYDDFWPPDALEERFRRMDELASQSSGAHAYGTTSTSAGTAGYYQTWPSVPDDFIDRGREILPDRPPRWFGLPYHELTEEEQAEYEAYWRMMMGYNPYKQDENPNIKALKERRDDKTETKQEPIDFNDLLEAIATAKSQGC